MDLNELDAKYRDKFEAVHFAIFLAIVIGVASFVAGAWSSYEQDQRLQRLERIEGIDSIGRRK
jgi:hypothetical protein